MHFYVLVYNKFTTEVKTKPNTTVSKALNSVSIIKILLHILQTDYKSCFLVAGGRPIKHINLK